MSKECTIRLQSGLLIVDVNKIWFKTKLQMLYLYESPYPFTRENLMVWNDIDSQEPDAYVRALKRVTRRILNVAPPDKIIIPERTECSWDMYSLRQELTIEKALVREQAKIIQQKDKEIEELRRKLKTEISPYSNETQYGETQRITTTGDQRVGGKGADSS
jgi:hypothetical protein